MVMEGCRNALAGLSKSTQLLDFRVPMLIARHWDKLISSLNRRSSRRKASRKCLISRQRTKSARKRSKQLLLVQYLHWQMVPSASPLNSKQQFPVVRHKLQA